MVDREQKTESLQVNAELSGAIAEAFKHYRDSMGLSHNAQAARSLMVKQLRAMGFLPQVEPQQKEQVAA